MGSIAVSFISHPEYVIMLGIFMLCCVLVFFGIKQKSRRRALKIATNVMTMGGLNNDVSDIDLFDEDTPGAAKFVTALSTGGIQMTPGEWT